MAKKKSKHTFWKRLHFKYRLSVMNENTLEEIWKINASMFSGVALLSAFAIFLIGITSFFIIATPIRYYLPGYLDSEIREQAIRTAFRTDSLQEELNTKDVYIRNLQAVFEGKILDLDSVKTVRPDTISIPENDPSLQKSEKEREFVKRYEEEERYNLSTLPSYLSGSNESTIFFKPVSGVVVKSFNPTKNQYGITLKITPTKTVSAAMEGTIMFAGYDINKGYTIQIQHKNGYVSTYTNNSLLLKDVGGKVRTGEAIAVIGSDKDNKAEIFAEFELWYKGSPVNPEDYILFK